MPAAGAAAALAMNRPLRRLFVHCVPSHGVCSCKRMLVPLKNKVERFHRFSQPRISVVILPLGDCGINRKMICAQLPLGRRAVYIVIRPVADFLRLVYAHYAKVNIAVIKRIIFCFKAFRSVLRVRIFKLLIKKIRMVKIKFAFGLRQILLKAAVIVVARRHHIRQGFHNTVKSAEHTVPLQFILTVVAVIACGENEFYVFIPFDCLFEHIFHNRIIGFFPRVAHLMVCYNNKFKAVAALPLCGERKCFAPVVLVAAGVIIFCTRF